MSVYKNYRNQKKVKVFRAEVLSPRIAWFQFLNLFLLSLKVCLIMGLLGIAYYGLRKAFDYTFHNNPDFQLKTIQLNPNNLFDEQSLVEKLGIDLEGNIFEYNVDLLEDHLRKMHVIESAKVERRLPGDLIFQINPRKALAWVSLSKDMEQEKRQLGHWVVDALGHLYACPEGQLALNQNLPILVLNEIADYPLLEGQVMKHPEFLSCMRLLKSIHTHSPEEIVSIDSISIINDWSISLKTRSGTEATFGLNEHERQLSHFSKSLKHANHKGYVIDRINLIPSRNIPIIIR